MEKPTVLIAIFLSIFFVYSVECDTVALWLLDDNLIPDEELPEDEPEATVHDLSGNEINGEINGAKFVAGKYNSALKFDGKDDFVDFGKPEALEIIKKEITMEAWVNVPEVPPKGTSQTIFGQFLGVAELLFSVDDGKLRGKVTTKFPWGVGDPDPFPANEWVHVALTYDGAELKLYRNGVMIASKPVSGSLNHVDGRRYILGASDPVERGAINGLIDEVRISDVALPPEKLGFFKRFSREGIMHIIEVESVEAADKLVTTWSQIKTGY
ncbi:LamG domain-containing protein [Candidatus Poribacteria bacterium]